MIHTNILLTTLPLLFLIALGNSFSQNEESQLIQYPTFQQWTKKFNKIYDSNEEFIKREQIYNNNIKQLQQINQPEHGANFYTDWTNEQFKNILTPGITSSISNKHKKIRNKPLQKQRNQNNQYQQNKSYSRLLQQTNSTKIPDTYDWRQHIKISTVKSQGQCGACWAFSTVAFFQSWILISNPNITQINLSQQVLVSCDNQSAGCQGGNLHSAMRRVLQQGGLPSEEDYPYLPFSKQLPDICTTDKIVKIPQTQTQMESVVYFNLTDQQKIKQFLFQRPLNIGVCAANLKTYYPISTAVGKRMLKCSSTITTFDHTVLLIGYTQTQWIIKNQWGPFWGIDGFGYISRNQSQNCCIQRQLHTIAPKTENCSLDNCLSCAGDSYCTSCEQGYYLSYKLSDMIQYCTLCQVQNCYECYDYWGDCKNCSAGYSFYYENGLCQKLVIQNCQVMYFGYCYECQFNYILSNDYLKCTENCKVKNCYDCEKDKKGVQTCLKCQQGFKLKQVNGQQQCQRLTCTVPNCRLCGQDGQCIECHYFYQNIEGSCQRLCAKDGCVYCDITDTDCYRCEDGKALNYYTDECEIYEVQNCQMFGLYLIFGELCDECKYGYDFINNDYNHCMQLCSVDNCITCELQDTLNCLQCESGYQLKGVNRITSCQKYQCAKNWTDCSKCNAQGECIACIEQEHIFNNKTQTCELQCKVQHCITCYNDSSTCIDCVDGYQVYLYSICYQPNQQNCVSWSEYQVNNQKQCLICEQEYDLVVVKLGQFPVCQIRCDDMYCKSCQQVDTSICQECKDGYRLGNVTDQSSGNQIFSCQRIIPMIQKCQLVSQNQTYCFKCVRNYFFIKDTKTNTSSCTKVDCLDQHCKQCTMNGQCIQCKNYYILTNQSSCTPLCPLTNCLNCSSQYSPQNDNQTCYQCVYGYSLQFQKRTCDQSSLLNCLQYRQNILQGQWCHICVEGYMMNNDQTQCNQQCDIQNCKLCDQQDLTQCFQCNDGYYLETAKDQTTSCVAYPCNVTDCALCDSAGICIQCSDSNYVVDNVTHECQLFCQIYGCDVCVNDSSTCIKCYSNLTLFDNHYCYTPNEKHCIGYYYLLDGTQLGCVKCQKEYQLYYIVREQQPVCKMTNCKDEYCEVCDSDLVTCKKCITGWKFISRQQTSNQTNSCIRILTQIRNCLIGNQNNTQCYYCIKFHFYNKTSNQCQPNNHNCQSNCEICSIDIFYDFKCKCQQGFIFSNYQGVCVLNTLTSTYCIQVQYNLLGKLRCSQCITGYVPSVDRLYCEKYCNVTFCQTCIRDNQSQCLNCLQGYFKKSFNQCAKCQVDKCIQCYETNDCQQCQMNYEIQITTSNNSTTEIYKCKDKPCPNNQLYDSVSDKCYCVVGSYLDIGQKKCAECGQSQCLSCNATWCFSCAVSMYLSSQVNKCFNCMENCYSCNSSRSCQQCYFGYVFLDSQRKCIESSRSSDGYLIIIQNQTTSDLSNSSTTTTQASAVKIIRCTIHCKQCQGINACTRCQQGYGINKDKKCQKCSQNCINCKITNPTTTNSTNTTMKCMQCSQFYYFTPSDNKCTICSILNCNLCQSISGKCQSCDQGFYLQNKSQSPSCVACSNNCISCVQSVKCLECDVNYYLAAQNNLCSPCQVDCLKCNSTSPTQCLPACGNGYYLPASSTGTTNNSINTVNICVSCSLNCISCSSSSMCIQCIQGYSLQDGRCLNTCTDYGCFSCDDITKCKKCFEGYQLNNTINKCTPDLKCNNNSSCEVCPLGYNLNTNKCIPCLNTQPQCIHCDQNNITQCVLCVSGFYLFNNATNNQATCLKCGQRCSRCLSQTQCTLCIQGSYLKITKSLTITPLIIKKQCILCSQNCLSCVSFSGQCLTCKQGYDLNNITGSCLNKQRIDLSLKLNMQLSQVSSHLSQIKSDLLSLLGKNYTKTNPQYLVIKSIRSGSVIIDSSLVVPPTQTSTTMLSSVISKLLSSNTIGGVPVISVDKVAMSSTTTTTNQPTQIVITNLSQKSTSTIIVISVVAGILVLILAAVAIRYYVVKKRQNKNNSIKKSQQSGKPNKNTSQTRNDTQNNRRSKNVASSSTMIRQSQQHIGQQEYLPSDKYLKDDGLRDEEGYKPKYTIVNERDSRQRNSKNSNPLNSVNTVNTVNPAKTVNVVKNKQPQQIIPTRSINQRQIRKNKQRNEYAESFKKQKDKHDNDIVSDDISLDIGTTTGEKLSQFDEIDSRKEINKKQHPKGNYRNRRY